VPEVVLVQQELLVILALPGFLAAAASLVLQEQLELLERLERPDPSEQLGRLGFLEG